MMIKSRLYPALAAVLFAGACTPAVAAHEVTNAELLKLIKAQSAEINELKQRLAAVEGARGNTVATAAANANAAPGTATASASTPTAPATDETARRQAQVDNAIADTRESESAEDANGSVEVTEPERGGQGDQEIPGSGAYDRCGE